MSTGRGKMRIERPTTEEVKEIRELTGKVEGWLHEAELILLYCLAKRCTGKGVIVEVGSWKGKSTIGVGLGSKRGNQVKIYAIDPHTGSTGSENRNISTYDDYIKNIKNARLDDLVIPIVKNSEEAAKDFHKKVELIFIDGDHEYEYVKKDFELWFPKIVDKGIMALHDTTTWPGPKKVAEKYILKSKNFKNVKILDSITFAEKTNEISIEDKLRNRIILILLYGKYITWRILIKIKDKL